MNITHHGQVIEFGAPLDGVRLNKLSFSVLGVLARQPNSGYDVVKALERLRPVKISQVYPLLAEMEAAGILRAEEIVQDGKPNKKIYTLTDLGHQVMRAWIASETEVPVIRDDFVSKVFSMWMSPAADRAALIADRITWLNSEIAFFEARLQELHVEFGTAAEDPDQWMFCRNMLYRRRLVLYREELLWCERVRAELTRPRRPNRRDSG